MITTAIVWDHRGRVKRGDEGPLEVRVTLNRKPYYINTGVRVREKQWQFDKVVQHPQANALNERLGIIVERIIRKVNKIIQSGAKDFDIARLRMELWESGSDRAFLDWVASEIPMLRLKDGTLKHYHTLLVRLNEYGEMSTWDDITMDAIYKWDNWLHELRGNAGKITQSGVYNYHKNLKALLTRAVRQGKLMMNPYFLLKGEFDRGDNGNTEYLTEDEMQRIMDFSPVSGTWMEKVRDLFIFQMFTGLAYSDAQAFDIRKYKQVEVCDEITGQKMKQWRIVGHRIKNGEPYVNMLLPPAVEVLEKYGMETPKISNAVYNRELKVIGTALGITTKMHTHLARHTFATWMLRNGVKFENVQKMLGHADIRTTQRYAKVMAESVHEEFQKVAKKIEKVKR